jgi:CRISPR-associated exonuclease Cas4
MVSLVRLRIGGKIDIYDREKKMLIERKTRIKDGRIHAGQRYQLYAQMYAMREMGYPVEHLRIHSLEDNKRYIVMLPDIREEGNFENTLWAMRTFDPLKHSEPAQHLCDISIYRHLSY